MASKFDTHALLSVLKRINLAGTNDECVAVVEKDSVYMRAIDSQQLIFATATQKVDGASDVFGKEIGIGSINTIIKFLDDSDNVKIEKRDSRIVFRRHDGGINAQTIPVEEVVSKVDKPIRAEQKLLDAATVGVVVDAAFVQGLMQYTSLVPCDLITLSHEGNKVNVTGIRNNDKDAFIFKIGVKNGATTEKVSTTVFTAPFLKAVTALAASDFKEPMLRWSANGPALLCGSRLNFWAVTSMIDKV